LLVGAWHEFDFRTDGEKQAENFISQCGSMSGMLRPMVKVTKYGIYNLHMKNADDVRENLQAFLDKVEEEYGRRPVIMCDSACYDKYIEPYFDSYTLWIIDHFGEPDEDTDWALWEYNPRVRTQGYENSKKYFAMTVFRREKDLENFKKNMLMSD
jgi:lysozyme